MINVETKIIGYHRHQNVISNSYFNYEYKKIDVVILQNQFRFGKNKVGKAHGHAYSLEQVATPF